MAAAFAGLDESGSSCPSMDTRGISVQVVRSSRLSIAQLHAGLFQDSEMLSTSVVLSRNIFGMLLLRLEM
jgi:hypothetical protein